MAGNVANLLTLAAVVSWTASLLATTAVPPAAEQAKAPAPAAHVAAATFQPSDTCVACHNGLITSTGEDVSIGADWRGSMMANSGRDPYWMAAVRREVMDHPQAQAAIEDECSICHLPMATFPARAAGGKGRIFPYLPGAAAPPADAALAADGVSCTVCHQLSPTRLGDPSTFTGGYVIDVTPAAATPRIFGPFAVDAGRASVMQSASGFSPAEGTHLQQAELCASCHTLFTHPLAPGVAPAVRLPEQTPYLEWQQSEFATTATCQSCHMPVVDTDTPITSVLGQPRTGLSRHSFRGGNFFMLRMLNRYRDELGVVATSRELDAATRRTVQHLQEDTARVAIVRTARAGTMLTVDVAVENLAGHKLPTAYPSRRAWLQLVVTDNAGRVVFESGAFSPDGRIAGNDQDADGARVEPHYNQIDRADQVQIYESVIGDSRGNVTTGLLSGVRYLKDNRLLPRGFRKSAATPDVAVHGAAVDDENFVGGRDEIRYAIDAGGATGLTVVARLWYQPIGFRWADNLRGYDAVETRRFVRYYDSMAAASAMAIAEARTPVR